MYLFVNLFICIYVFLNMYIRKLYMYIRENVSIYTHVYIHFNVCIYMYIYICMYVCKYIYICMHIYICVYVCVFVEGSLEVKLPTIWTNEKQSREGAERRERVRRKKMQVRKKVGESRNTVFFHGFVAPEG